MGEMDITTEPTVLIRKGGGYYWVDRIGGTKIQLSNAEIEEGRYVVIDESEALADVESTPDDANDVATLRAIIESQAKEIARQAAEIEENKPTQDASMFLFETIKDIQEFYGPKHLRDLAQAELASINRVRMKEGYDRITYTDEEFEASIQEVMEKLLADRAVGPAEEGPLMRTLKMFAPDGSLRQIPYEGQINNIAGSLEDGFRKYTKKGFKRTEPMFCPAQNCWQVSAEDNGKKLFTGYCSQDHFNRTENGGGREIPGVTTSGAISGRT